MASAIHDGEIYEKFNLFTFVIGILAAAGLLLVLPIGFIFHPAVLIYAALLGTATFFVAIYRMTKGRKAG